MNLDQAESTRSLNVQTCNESPAIRDSETRVDQGCNHSAEAEVPG